MNFEKLEIMQRFKPSFDEVWPMSKMAHYPPKYTCMLYLPNGYLNTVSNFNFEKVKKSAFLRTWFDET